MSINCNNYHNYHISYLNTQGEGLQVSRAQKKKKKKSFFIYIYIYIYRHTHTRNKREKKQFLLDKMIFY